MSKIIPGQFCADCAETTEEPVPAAHELDRWGPDSGGGGFLCDGCMGRRYDAQQEAAFEDCWGASQPVTLQERYDSAAKEKRDLDRGHAVMAAAHQDRPLRRCATCGSETHHEDYCEA